MGPTKMTEGHEHWSLESDHTTPAHSPLMKEIAEGVYHVGLAELALDEGHDLWQVRFAEILTIEDGGHEM